MYKKFAIFLVISAIVVTGNYLSGSSPPPEKTIVYTVQPGDTLWSIAVEFCDDDTNIMEEIHQIKVQNKIQGHLKIGQKLIIKCK